MAKDNAGLGYARALSVAKQLVVANSMVIKYYLTRPLDDSPDETINREGSTVSQRN